jgi:signal transduction histidine kinase
LPKVAQGLKSCIYRIVQECLNNAARYADGKGQRVEAFERDAAVTVSVSDRGPGIRDAADMDGRPRLGILGAKKRIEAAGGSFHIASRPDIGTRITAVLPVETDRSASP